MSYRNQIRIIADILSVTKDYGEEEGVGITTILRKANLSYSRLMQILRDLIKAGLIIEIERDKGSKYMISDKGKKFLQAYIQFEDFAQSYGLRL
ncbi:MAG: DUF4364 family protein [Nitrososphaerales archaeon]